MTARDITFSNISNTKMFIMVEESPSSGKTKLGYTPFERQYLKMMLKAKKEKVKRVLKQNKEGLAEAKKRARSQLRSKSSDPPVNRNRREKTKNSHT